MVGQIWRGRADDADEKDTVIILLLALLSVYVQLISAGGMGKKTCRKKRLDCAPAGPQIYHIIYSSTTVYSRKKEEFSFLLSLSFLCCWGSE